MKKRTLFTLSGILTCFTCVYLTWLSLQPHLSENITSLIDSCMGEETVSRLRIAFILGEDKEADNPYYDEAFRYYTTNSDERVDTVVRTCRSLVEVKNFLRVHNPSNSLPWGTIHLVSHGNQWNGLSVKVAPDSKRATTERILSYIQSHLSDTLSQDIIDSETEIFLHGCGVGNDRTLVDAVGKFFDGSSLVYAPTLFEYYASTGSENPQSQRYLAKSWLLSYPMGNKPSPTSLSNLLREKYPDASVDWATAVSKEAPAWIGDAYHYTFEVPVKWVIAVDSLPDLADESKLTRWLYAQQEIANELKRLQIPIEKFNWSFNMGYADTPKGKSPAVFVKGYCTMLCVLQALTEIRDRNILIQKPFVPALTDRRFYYSSTQTNTLSAAINHVKQSAFLSK